MRIKNIIIFDDIFGITTLYYFLNKYSSNLNIREFNQNSIPDSSEIIVDDQTLIFLNLNSYDLITPNLITKQFKDLKKVIISSIPINVYYSTFNKYNIVGYINKNEFNCNTINALFDKIIMNKKYLSNTDAEILLDFDYHNNFTKTNSKNLNKLSLQEFKVLDNLRSGKSISQISDQLKINKSTVSTYKKRILTKYHASNIFQLQEAHLIKDVAI